MNSSMKQSWLHFRSSKTLKARRNSYRRLPAKHTSRKVVTLNRMNHSFEDSYEDKTISASPSQQDFMDMLSQVQGRRYDNQRSPYPSPTLLVKEDSVDHIMTNGDSEEDQDGGVNTPTNNRHVFDEEESTAVEEKDSLHSSSSNSFTSNHVTSPTHLQPLILGSPGSPSLKPNRRSVEALRCLLKTDEAPFPLIINPPDGGYWVQNGEYQSSKGADGMWRAPEIDTEHFRVDTDNTALMYGCHFVGKSHRNFYTKDSQLGPLIFSLMFDSSSSFDPMIRMILRTQTETIYKVYPSAQLSRKLEPEEYLAILVANLKDGDSSRIDNLKKVQHPNVPELIQKFDEHCVAKQHKVGVIYQKFGQTTEEEMFCNNNHSPAFKEFLELLGETVSLKGFEKYRGGLDTYHNQTGKKSVYTEFKGQEIMFHVSTLLPFDAGDRQQVARKRHIGNDIVLVVFQDQNTPYSPDCVRSRFLHAHIVVQVEHSNSENTIYKVAVAAKEEVPDFTPPLPTPAVFAKGHDFREWLLTKILNAESQCHKAPDFHRLTYRTRTQLFSHLIKDLSSSQDDTDSPMGHNDKRKSLAFDNTYDVTQSPRRRRMTFGAIFPKRKVSSVTPSPKLSPRKVSISHGPPANVPSKKFTTSTPDLTRINCEDDGMSVGSQTMDRKKQGKLKGPSKGKKFTLRVKDRKKSRHSVMTTSTTDDVHSGNNKPGYFRQISGNHFSSEESSLRSSLNWSVPSDLPIVVAQQPTPIPQSDPNSLENLAITLEPDDTTSNLDRFRSTSNPNILEEKRRSRKIRPRIPAEFYPVSDVQTSPGSAGPHTSDVCIQVDAKQVFTFPTPPNSVSPTLPLELSHHVSPSHHALLYTHKHASPQKSSDHNAHELISHHSSTSSLDNRHSGASFPFVPEEDEEGVEEGNEEKSTPGKSSRRSFMLGSSSATEVIREDEGDGSSIGSSDSLEEMENDITYQSLVGNLQMLTLEVAKLQKQQMRLCKENTHLALSVHKWKEKYKVAKMELTKRDDTINSLQQDIKKSDQRERKSSEIGTAL